VSSHQRILICQHLTCRKQGAAKILAAFQTTDLPDRISYESCGCLGQCGNGPNILILPTKICYYRVTVRDILTIVRALEDSK
jgi:(2Fe-2S) ferredoxin